MRWPFLVTAFVSQSCMLLSFVAFASNYCPIFLVCAGHRCCEARVFWLQPLPGAWICLVRSCLCLFRQFFLLCRSVGCWFPCLRLFFASAPFVAAVSLWFSSVAPPRPSLPWINNSWPVGRLSGLSVPGFASVGVHAQGIKLTVYYQVFFVISRKKKFSLLLLYSLLITFCFFVMWSCACVWFLSFGVVLDRSLFVAVCLLPISYDVCACAFVYSSVARRSCSLWP